MQLTPHFKMLIDRYRKQIEAVEGASEMPGVRIENDSGRIDDDSTVFLARLIDKRTVGNSAWQVLKTSGSD